MKNPYRHALLAVLLLIGILSPLFSQMSIDPNDVFYEYVEEWEIRGLLRNVPPIRPYPINNIKEILQNVIKRGNEHDVEIAIAYWQQLSGRQWRIVGEASATGKVSRDDDGRNFEKQIVVSPYFAGDGYLYKDWLSYSCKMGLNVRTEEDMELFLPRYVNSPFDARQDPAKMGPAKGFVDVNGGASLGNTTFFMQAGLNRTGYGPFFGEGLALNESSYHSANLSFTVLKKNWSYVQQYSAIGATRGFDGSGLAPEKFVAFHALEYKIGSRFSLGYYESIVYGNRFDLSYFLPAPYMAAQGIGGNDDNLQMGVVTKYRPFDNFLWQTEFFVDDLDVNKIFKFDFDGKNRFALKTGVFYAPDNSFCSKIKFNYTCIMPYTYTHWEYDPDKTGSADIKANYYNYQNYTNNNVHIGTPFEPNSDAISFSVDFQPTKELHLSIGTNFSRHANIVESLSDDEAFEYLCADYGVYATDGSERTHSMFDGGRHVDTAWEELNFLNQKTKMYVFQGSIFANYTLPKLKMGTLSFNLGYVFEYIHNKGVDENIYDGGRVRYDAATGQYIYTGGASDAVVGTHISKHELVERFKAAWKDNLYDEVNNYFSVGVKYVF